MGTIPHSALVRYSRDGDQFHYLWAARRCLRLLQPTCGLVAISIEGASVREVANGTNIEVAEEIIDVAEYYGSESISDASRINYIQLKHSTQRANHPWVPSGLEDTIKGFARRYAELVSKFDAPFVASHFRFCFVSNRPIDSKFVESVNDAGNNLAPRHLAEYNKLKGFTGLQDEKLSTFCSLLSLEGEQPGFLEQRKWLGYETTKYLAGSDVDAPVRLKELVVRKATSEGGKDPSITRMDVLRALNVVEQDLFPAPSYLSNESNSITRLQETSIAEDIIASNVPVVIHASGGVGKSVLAQRLSSHFPPGSATVVYDCFANGAYRRVGSKRHRHKDALVQIANEFSSRAFCELLIPTPHADPSDFIRAFLHRLRQAVSSVADLDKRALVFVIVDAADNAEMVAQEFADGRSFIRDLLRETLPPGVRLIALSRTERLHLLELTSTVHCIELKPFEKSETEKLLKAKFPNASELDVEEFHRLTSRNPRVQTAALQEGHSLSEVLRGLGPQPTSVDDVLKALLEKSVNRLLDGAPGVERFQIERICTALAVLRPFIPISILALLTNVNEAAIKSFAADLGRPLLIVAEALQFRDEPTETWFRMRFKPKTNKELRDFVDALRPLADGHPYAASALPQLMLEAGQLSELVELALSSQGLAEDRPVETRDIEVQRLFFALKASLRARHYDEAAKLAMKAGQETVGHERQIKLFQENPDLVARFLKSEQVLELVSRRPFSGRWVGAAHEYEATILSYIPDFVGDARSRLRMAYDWLRAWLRLPDQARQQEHVDANDLANLAVAELHISGPEECARFLRRWRPWELSYRAGATVARMCIDHGRYSELDDVALAAGSNVYLVLAINCELRRVQRRVPDDCIRQSLRMLTRCKRPSRENVPNGSEPVLAGVVAIIESAYLSGSAPVSTLHELLARFLPERPYYSIIHDYGRDRITWLKAFALRSALAGTDLTWVDVASENLAKELKDSKQAESSQLREFKDTMSILIPWHKLRAKRLVQRQHITDLSSEIELAREESGKGAYSWSSERSRTQDEVAEIWFDILTAEDAHAENEIATFRNWLATLKSPLFTPTSTHLARVAARVGAFGNEAHAFARSAFDVMDKTREDAESKSAVYVGLCRALIALDISESQEYFNEAIRVASRMGDEVLDRWSAILDLADEAADGADFAEYAYRIARAAEVLETFDGKHFAWEATTTTLCRLSPRSALTIFSRWRDRGFVPLNRLLPIVTNELIRLCHIEPDVAAALVGFRANWRYDDLLEAALSHAQTTENKSCIWHMVFSYFRLDSHSASEVNAVREVALKNRIIEPELDEVFQNEVSREAEENLRNNYQYVSPVHDEAPVTDWDKIFAGLEIHTDAGLTEAHNRFRSLPPPHQGFITELFRRVSLGKEVELIKTYTRSATFDLYSNRRFLEELPIDWKSRLSIRTALKEVIKELCARFCLEITRSRYYQVLPFKETAELAGFTEAELADVVLQSISSATEDLDSSRLFTLVGVLAPRLTSNQSLSALDFGLALIERTITDEDADGPWGEHIYPPSECRASLAGFVYGCLGAPKASFRWQAAHVVKNLCILNKKDIVADIVKFADGADYRPYTDADFKFYELTARQWLLIALSRVAQENADKVSDYLPFLLKYALNEDHVIIKHFACSAALAIAKHNSSALNEDLLAQLTKVNRSPFPIVSSPKYKRYEFQKNPAKTVEKKKNFYFSYDMDRYWFEPLALCFAKNQQDVADMAEGIVLDEWNVAGERGWESDERAKRRLYDDQENWHSHGGYPRTDDLSFYLSYHAMMIAAGRLLASTPIHQDPQEPQDEFREWVQRHTLSRADGRWLADRRDPPPSATRMRLGERIDDQHWRWCIRRDDFDRAIGIGERSLTLWGNWTTTWGRQERSVHITSAIVSPRRANALLRAAQSAPNAYRFPLPSASDEEIQQGEFELRGWIVDDNATRRLDEYDLWGGTIHFPGPQPASYLSALLNLTADLDYRRHVSTARGGDGQEFLSSVWGYQAELKHDTEGEHGSIARVTPSFLTELLVRTNKELIVRVIIEQRIRTSHYEAPVKGDFDGYLPPSSRFYIFGLDGNFRTL